MYFATSSTAFVFILITCIRASAQKIKDTADTILFENRDGFIPPGYEEVSTENLGGFGAIEKCGQGASRGVDLCVPYYQCDGETKTIIQDGRTNGFGLIDIRFGEDKPCDHYLDICCAIPKDGLPPSSESPNPEPSTEDEGPIEQPPVVIPPTPKPTPKPKPVNPWTCGIRNDNGIDFKITGNKDREAEYGEFPWMVAITKANYNPPNDNLLVCGGSLIAPNVVLTGAHCVHKFQSNELKIRAGEWDTQTNKERLPYQEKNIKQIIIHEDFNSQVLFNDIALLVLESPVEEAENVGIICLPQKDDVFTSSNCFATGWGKDKFGSKGVYQAILKKLNLPIVPKDECQERLRTTRLGKYFILDKSFMCAGGLKEQDTCTGDGGSPFVCSNPNKPHQYSQVGIVAWGIGCGLEVPAVYADVALFRDWIDNKLSFTAKLI
ncbi:hypothetical protein HHI36_016228 [Cryptolaemus montrouzieri]|uniref:Phenoloxidase-activating factor 2 n=2 Tax=Cryptolaemus montrouzieri TaxID=559131 RepID=A0ABD2NJ26_9CUCU